MLKKTYFPYLDGLRALSIIWVVIHHMPVDFPKWLAAFANRGDLGVEFFFAISGYVVIQSLFSSAGLGEFYLKRIFRIIPAYWLTLLVIFGLSLIDAKLHSKLISIQEILPSFPFFYYNYATLPPSGTVPGVLNIFWSLCFEEQFYVFLGLLFLIFPKHLRRVLPLVVLFIIILRNLTCYFGEITEAHELQFQTHLRLDAILIGCIGFLEKERFKKFITKSILWPSLMIFILLACVHMQEGPKLQGLIYTLLPLNILCLLISLESHPRAQRILSLNFLTLIGSCSYEIYLTHEILLGALVRFGLNHYAFAYLGIGVLTAILVGYFFYRFVSHPLNLYLRQKFIARRALP